MVFISKIFLFRYMHLKSSFEVAHNSTNRCYSAERQHLLFESLSQNLPAKTIFLYVKIAPSHQSDSV